MEGEHGCTLLLLLVKFVRVKLPLPDRKRLRFIPRQVLRDWLHIQEDRLFCRSIVILCVDDEFSTIIHLASVNDEGVVISDVTLHVLNALLKLCVVVVPADAAVGKRNNAAGESGTLSFERKGALWFDDKSWGSTLPIDEHFLHPVFLHLEFA